MRGTTWERLLSVISCAVFLGACTASKAQTSETAAPPSATPSESEVPWPGSYAEGEEGRWTVELTRQEIMAGAREQAKYIKWGERDEHIDIGCVRDFVDSIGFKRSITWDLYLRDGSWILYGAVDGKDPKPYDGGSYRMPHIENEMALFTSQAPEVRDDLWRCSRRRRRRFGMTSGSTHRSRGTP